MATTANKKGQLIQTAIASAITTAPLVRAKVIAEHFDVHQRTVCLWADQGVIPCIRIGGSVRFDKDAVLAAVAGTNREARL